MLKYRVPTGPNPQDLDAPLRLAAQRKINGYRQRYADNQNIFFHDTHTCECVCVLLLQDLFYVLSTHEPSSSMF
jgi:hypothetical protein